jgi:hypothetical protein
MEPLPALTYHGYLPTGVHECSFEELEKRFATNAARITLCHRLADFLRWAGSTGSFSEAYIDGGFITDKALPEDIDVILQTKVNYGPAAFSAMEPFFAKGLDTILREYSVHLHFWCEGFPAGMSDFRCFFQYLRPQDAAPKGLKEGARKGIVRLKL